MKNLVSITLLLFLGLPFYSFAQLEIQTGYGYGYVLGSPYTGHALTGDISYSLPKKLHRFKVRGGITYFRSSTGTYYEVFDNQGSTIVESTQSNPVPILLGPTEKKLFKDGFKNIESTLRKYNYSSFNLDLGFEIIDKEKSKLTAFLGGTIGKVDRVFTPTVIQADIDLGSYGQWNLDLYSTAYVTYWDAGFNFGLQYKYYVYKTFSIVAELAANRHMWDDDGVYYGAIKLGISI